MKVKGLWDYLNAVRKYANHDNGGIVGIIDSGRVYFGARPTIGVQSMLFGCDWDSGKLLITTKEKININGK